MIGKERRRREGEETCKCDDDLGTKFERLSVQKSMTVQAPYRIRLVKFQTTETIEGLGWQNSLEDDTADIKVVRKSRNTKDTKTRINMINDGDTSMNKNMLGTVFDDWVKSANSEHPAPEHRNHSPMVYCDRKKSRSVKQKTSSSSVETESEPIPKHHEVIKMPSTIINRKEMLKKTRAYKDTVASTLRYNFRRKKKIFPYYLIQHVMKYQRPPFWNYTKKSEGFNALLTGAQLQYLYELVER